MDSSFYRPAAYAIAQTVVDIPLVLAQVTIFDIVVYFMSDLARAPSQFFISLLILWVRTSWNLSFLFKASVRTAGHVSEAEGSFPFVRNPKYFL